MKNRIYRIAFLFAFFSPLITLAASEPTDAILRSGQSPSPNVMGDSEEDWEMAGYKNPKIQILNLYPAADDPTKYTHQLALDIVVVRGTKWTTDIIISRYTQVTAIYSTCGVKFEPVRLIYVDSPNGLRDFYPGDSIEQRLIRGSSYGFGEKMPTGTSRLTNIHVKGLKDGNFAISGPVFRVGKDSRLLNKNWISEDVMSYGFFSTILFKQYIPEAHEIGHTLMNIQDVQGANLMSHDLEKVNNELSCKKQPIKMGDGSIQERSECELIKENELVRPIIK